MKKTSSIYIVLILSIIAGVLNSCDDKIRELDELNRAPSFQYFRKSSVNWETPNNEVPIMDSAKVWTASNNASYPAILRVTDVNNNIAKINIFSHNPDVSFFVNGDTYYSNYEVTNNEEFNVAFRSNGAGVGDFKVSASDDFGKFAEMMFRITFVNNRPPIAKIKVVLINSPTRNYQIIANESYDKDKSLGGAVVEYEYTINNVIIHTSQPQINHIFTVGTHDLKLRVKDNDDEWSEYVTYTLVVN